MTPEPCALAASYPLGGGTLTLDPVTPGDQQFLRGLYATTREQELSGLVWEPEEHAAFMGSQWEAQRVHYEAHFPKSDHRLIRLDGEPIGRIWVDDSDEETYVLDMALLPEQRSRGIATLLLGELIAAAEPRSKTVKLSVAVLNPRPLSLLERLGFERLEEEAPFPNVYLIRRPASAVRNVMMEEATTAA